MFAFLTKLQKESSALDLRRLSACIIIATFLGYLIGDDSEQVRNLQSELAQLKRSRERIPLRKNLDGPRQARQEFAVNSAPSTSLTSPEDSSDDLRPSREDQERQDAWVAEMARERDAEYTKVYSEFGLAPEDIEAFKQKLTAIHKSANAAGFPLTILARKKNSYDEDLRTLIGEENYARYRQYEDQKPAQREFEMIRGSSKVPLGPDDAQRIIELIKTEHAYTTERWDGPYDSSPTPTVGRAQGIEHLKQSIAKMTQTANALLAAAQQQGIADPVVKVLQDHYSNKITEFETRLARFEKPRPFEEHKLETIIEMRAAAMRMMEEAKKRAGK